MTLAIQSVSITIKAIGRQPTAARSLNDVFIPSAAIAVTRHQREASYCAGEKWGNGFLLAHIDKSNKRTQFEYLDLSHPAAMIGGRHYERTIAEPVLDLVRM